MKTVNPNNISIEIRGALARGYCSPENQHKVVDPTLIEAMAREIDNLLAAYPAVSAEPVANVELELKEIQRVRAECYKHMISCDHVLALAEKYIVTPKPSQQERIKELERQLAEAKQVEEILREEIKQFHYDNAQFGLGA